MHSPDLPTALRPAGKSSFPSEGVFVHLRLDIGMDNSRIANQLVYLDLIVEMAMLQTMA